MCYKTRILFTPLFQLAFSGTTLSEWKSEMPPVCQAKVEAQFHSASLDTWVGGIACDAGRGGEFWPFPWSSMPPLGGGPLLLGHEKISHSLLRILWPYLIWERWNITLPPCWVESRLCVWSPRTQQSCGGRPSYQQWGQKSQLPV